ncbi:hypothetical protein RhiirC2_861639 [Rhizophagus irregularis]|uniref:Uncharacterized protein n=1 Tax=Rhizophagus irregularis TaxID=588596 RepID=A0A2N1NVE0_9GLOM|nr:hypothetical protein RhiirC2_861639 [Rhizophagus irregularis]
MKGKKPIFIDLVDENNEGNDDMIQQNERNNDQSTQQNERNNDSNESALQMQVEELTRLLKTVMKGKQKDPPEEDDQTKEDENQEVVDKNQEEVDKIRKTKKRIKIKIKEVNIPGWISVKCKWFFLKYQAVILNLNNGIRRVFFGCDISSTSKFPRHEFSVCSSDDLVSICSDDLWLVVVLFCLQFFYTALSATTRECII